VGFGGVWGGVVGLTLGVGRVLSVFFGVQQGVAVGSYWGPFFCFVPCTKPRWGFGVFYPPKWKNTFYSSAVKKDGWSLSVLRWVGGFDCLFRRWWGEFLVGLGLVPWREGIGQRAPPGAGYVIAQGCCPFAVWFFFC